MLNKLLVKSYTIYVYSKQIIILFRYKSCFKCIHSFCRAYLLDAGRSFRTSAQRRIGLLQPCCYQTYIRTPLEDKEHLDNRWIHLVAGCALQCVFSPRRIGLQSTNDDGAVENLPKAFSCQSHSSQFHSNP